MNIKVKRVQPSAKPHYLAVASVEVVDGEDDSMVIENIAIFQNNLGQLMASPGSHPGNEDDPHYGLAVEPNRQLWRKIEHAVLSAYVRWTLKLWQSTKEGRA
jgi:DNA-binding cell septation regulator SpoVG